MTARRSTTERADANRVPSLARQLEEARVDLDRVVARQGAVEHPRQRGLTMRTIETLMAGKKLVTTNEHILACNLYHPSRVHVISRFNPEIPTHFLEQSYLAISDALRSYYSCEGWVSELLELQDAAKNSRNLLA